MNRRQLAFIVIVNAMVSLIIALLVVWVFEIRRPDADEVTALGAARPQAVIAATPTASSPSAVTVSLPQEGPAQEPAAIAAPETVEPQEVYVVRGGDSLVAIAARYNVTVDQIVSENNLSNPDFVFSGQRLIIPQAGRLTEALPDDASAVVGIEIGSFEGVGDLASESVQVVNDSDQAVSLEGWRLVREGGAAYTFGNLPLFPGGSVRVITRAGDDSSVSVYWGQSEAQWQSGSVAQLLNERGVVVHWTTAP